MIVIVWNSIGLKLFDLVIVKIKIKIFYRKISLLIIYFFFIVLVFII